MPDVVTNFLALVRGVRYVSVTLTLSAKEKMSDG